jgi:hypothetical protein
MSCRSYVRRPGRQTGCRDHLPRVLRGQRGATLQAIGGAAPQPAGRRQRSTRGSGGLRPRHAGRGIILFPAVRREQTYVLPMRSPIRGSWTRGLSARKKPRPEPRCSSCSGGWPRISVTGVLAKVDSREEYCERADQHDQVHDHRRGDCQPGLSRLDRGEASPRKPCKRGLRVSSCCAAVRPVRTGVFEVLRPVRARVEETRSKRPVCREERSPAVDPLYRIPIGCASGGAFSGISTAAERAQLARLVAIHRHRDPSSRSPIRRAAVRAHHERAAIGMSELHGDVGRR